VLRIGFNKQNRNGYIFVGNSDWQSLVPGVDYQMTAQFAIWSPWSFPARGIFSGGTTMLMATFSDPDVLAQFATQPTVSFTHQGRSVATLNLHGCAAPVNAMANCQDIANAAADPFRTQPAPSTTSRDPSRPAVRR